MPIVFSGEGNEKEVRHAPDRQRSRCDVSGAQRPARWSTRKRFPAAGGDAGAARNGGSATTAGHGEAPAAGIGAGAPTRASAPADIIQPHCRIDTRIAGPSAYAAGAGAAAGADEAAVAASSSDSRPASKGTMRGIDRVSWSVRSFADARAA
ncbi:hypothetical protein [Luteimonas huabeiensis]|uniref:hypothetical protein n=1 Tax=Luteimonas huabeiensis TaxID=1244513 RepID=UPI0012682DCF|nr:hypothetical protein [Luteimonas huabeiensis]